MYKRKNYLIPPSFNDLCLYQTMLHGKLNLKAVTFFPLDCLKSLTKIMQRVTKYVKSVPCPKKQQILRARCHLTGTDVERNGFALSFHRSQVVGNKLLHLGHRHVCCCSLKLQPLVICIDLRKRLLRTQHTTSLTMSQEPAQPPTALR